MGWAVWRTIESIPSTWPSKYGLSRETRSTAKSNNNNPAVALAQLSFGATIETQE